MRDAPEAFAAGSLARALFSPGSVALVGASTNPKKNTGRALRYLQQHGYAGKIFPINPKAAHIDGIRAYPSLMDLPQEVEHAFIMVGADAVAQAVQDCAAAGVRCATILSEGFGEAGEEGRAREQAVLDAARAHGIRLLGPNSIGVVTTDGFACSANAAIAMPELPRGGYGVISQSGSMIGAFLSHGAARGIGFRSVVSVGNEIDLSVGEIGEAMLEDPHCTAILLFLEAIKDREALERLAHRAEAARKPILAYKLGRSKAGQALAASHTGALSGDDAMVDAVLARLGIARVRILEALYEAPPLFIGSAPTHGKRVAVVTTTGGGGAMVVDAMASIGLEIAPDLPEVRAILQTHGVPGGGHGLIDLTLAGAKPELVREVLNALIASPEVDAVTMVIGSSSQFHPELAVAPLRGFAHTKKPLAVHLVPAADTSRRMLTEEGLAVFRTAEACAEGVSARLERRGPAVFAGAPASLIREIEEELAATPRTALDETEAQQIFARLGVSGPDGQLVTSADAARAAFMEVGGPVVMKIVSPDILHKSDSGGIALGVLSAEDAAATFDALTASQAAVHPSAEVRGVLVQRMVSGHGEALVGFRRDPLMGPVVVLGAGGVLAELLQDTTLRVAPVDLATAHEMVSEVRSFAAYAGFRNRPRGDLEAVARVVVAVSRLAACESVAEAEVNPLMILAEGEGACALDALIVKTAESTG